MSTQAIVIGGSIAGMCAARVLSDFFDRIIVVERDSCPEVAKTRSGVPQGHLYHSLTARGRVEFEHLFPGFNELMLRRGARQTQTGVTIAVSETTQPIHPPFDMTQLTASRGLIESTIRDLFTKLPNIELLQETEVFGLTARTEKHLRCTGAEVRSRRGGNSGHIEADLVVDASGRFTHAGIWLARLGISPPEESVVNGFSGYSGRWFQMRSETEWPCAWWWTDGAVAAGAPPDHLNGAVLILHEQGRWLLNLFGINSRYPPTDAEDFSGFLNKFGSSTILRMLELMEPVSRVYSNRAFENRWRHYERLKNSAEGFVALGDAACAYNPTHGHGMTVAAVSATILRETIERYGQVSSELTRNFFAAQARFLRDVWRLSVNEDFRFPATVGHRSIGERLLGRYFSAVRSAAAGLHVRRRMWEVNQLVKPVSALFEPRVMGQAAVAKLCELTRRVFSRLDRQLRD